MLKDILYAEDEEKLRKAFEVPADKSAPVFSEPKQFGGGRLEILFPEGVQLRTGTLHPGKGEARITPENKNGKPAVVVIRQSVLTNMGLGRSGFGPPGFTEAGLKLGTYTREIVDYGLYKQACVTPPHAKASGLQGLLWKSTR